jgi:hypothetical protein
VARQAAGDRVDGEAHLLALGAQLAGQFGNVLLRLRHGHAVARHDDDAVGVVQRGRDAVGVDGDLLALDLHRRTGVPPKPPRITEMKRAVHRLAHDVGQDRTGRADQRADHDQQVVAEREADGRRRPARIGVEHRHHHRHVGAADAHDQVVADEQRQQRHDHQRQLPAPVLKYQISRISRQRRGCSVQHVPAGSLLAAEAAPCRPACRRR